MSMISVRDVSFFVDVRGRGEPLLLMHGGPGTDHVSLLPFAELSDTFTTVLYDHRCNGRSIGPSVETMTWENLTADADALRERLGFEKWSVLGHSFGGHVALEYALRYPQRVSKLVLLDTGPDASWAREKAPLELTRRGYDSDKVELVRRWFNGEIEPGEMFPIFRQIADVYSYKSSRIQLASMLVRGGWRTKFRGEAFVFASRTLLPGWSVVERLHEIQAPTLVMAGKQDFVFPPACQQLLATGIPNSKLLIVDHAGHNPDFEQPRVVMTAVREFVGGERGGVVAHLPDARALGA